MSNDISRQIKKKNDAQFRMNRQERVPSTYEDPTGIIYTVDPNAYMKSIAQGKNIIIGTSGSIQVINAVMNLLQGKNITVSEPDPETGAVIITAAMNLAAGDNISISEPDPENGAVTVTGTIGGKAINTAGLADKFVMAYDLATDTIIFTEMAGGGVLTQATETELGGIKAKEKSTESAEIAIDTMTGKLYGPAPDAAANGLPVGGATGQILSKVNETDYNAQWVDPPTGGGSEPFLANINLIGLLQPTWTPPAPAAMINGNTATSDYANLGSGTRELIADFRASVPIYRVEWWMFYGDGRTYRKCGLYGSNDNVNWTTLREPVDTIFTAGGLIIDIESNFRYLKLHCEANATYNSNDMVEFKIIGKIPLQGY